MMDCRDETLIEEIFGSVTEFARLIEEHGDNFQYNNWNITYNPHSDIHTFTQL